ncbi:MAG: transglycosylase SLT domain-containing protein [Alphaproteobacteria bacterium]|nr:transglycosylase SLT domain-containing protein [Alphaproteobacteria bacterium]
MEGAEVLPRPPLGIVLGAPDGRLGAAGGPRIDLGRVEPSRADGGRSGGGHGPGPAVGASGAGGAPGLAAGRALCGAAIAAAEARHSIPGGLLAAIGQVESGWHPYALNTDGRAVFATSIEDAAARLVAAHAAGARNADAGCLQISLRHHPQAFRTLGDALTPALNADYSARYLVSLYRETGSWARAIAAYHSRNPERAQRYLCHVWRTHAAGPHGALSASDRALQVYCNAPSR